MVTVYHQIKGLFESYKDCSTSQEAREIEVIRDFKLKQSCSTFDGWEHDSIVDYYLQFHYGYLTFEQISAAIVEASK